MLATVKKFLPLLFILFIWFIFASPYFIKGKVPLSSTYLVNFFAPWSHYGQLHGPIKNNAMPDVHSQIYPWKKFSIDELKNAQVPLWNPYSFSGNPHLANFQTAVFSPFNFLFFVLPFLDAWSLTVLLGPVLAGICMYLTMRALSISKMGSLIGSTSFMFCGFIVVWMAYGTLSIAIAFLPLSIFAIIKIFQKTRLAYVLLLAFTLSLSLFSGHFQTSLYALIFTICFIFFCSLTHRTKKGITFSIAGFLLGVMFALPQLLPTMQLYLYSVRSEIFINAGGIPFHYLVTAFAPDFFGNPVTRNDWLGSYAEWASFVGIVPLTLALFSIKNEKRFSMFFAISSLLVLILALESPLQKIIGMLHIPVLSTSNPNRIIVLFSFCMAVLAGFGFDNLEELLKKRKLKKIAIPLMAIAGLFIFIWVSLLVFKIIPVDKIPIAKNNLILPTVFFIALSVVVFLRFRPEVIVLPIGKSGKLKPFIPFVLGSCLLILTAFDSLRFAQKWMPFDPRSLVYPQIPFTNAVREHIGQGRIFGNLGGEFTIYYGFPTIEGYDPLYIGRYGEFIRGAAQGELMKGERSLVKLDKRGKYTDRVLDFLGVSLVFQPIADTNQGWAYPVWENNKRYTLAYQDDKFQLFKNTKAMPRAAVFYNFEIQKDSESIIKRFYNQDFDFRNVLLLEEDSGISNAQEGSGSARILSYMPNKVTIEVNTNKPAMVLLTDNYYPTWRAYVNEQPQKIYRADYTFRAIKVPVGTAKVEFKNENWYF